MPDDQDGDWQSPAGPARRPDADPWAVPGSAAGRSIGQPDFGAPTEPPKRNHSRALIWIGALVVVLLVVAAAGGLIGIRQHSAKSSAQVRSSAVPQQTQPAQSAPSVPSPQPLAGTPSAANSAPTNSGPANSGPANSPGPGAGSGPLDNYLLAPSEVGAGALMFLIDGGRSATDQATLDFCNFDYTSESLRTARVQVEYAGGGSQAAGNEFVQYQKGGTAKAFAELQQAVAHCPATSQTDGITSSQLQRSAVDPALVADQIVLSYRVDDPTGGVPLPWQAVAYQFDGTYFSGIYVYGLSRSLALAQAERLGVAAAHHLAEAAAGKPGTGGGPFQSLDSAPPDSGVQV